MYSFLLIIIIYLFFKKKEITLKKWHQLKNQIIKKMEMCVEVIDNELCIKDK